MTSKYPDTTLDEKFKSIERLMGDHFEATTKVLGDIKEQTTKTNGSVRSLQLWKSYTLGGFSVFVIVVIPALGFLAYQVIENSNHVAAIESVLTELLKKNN